jgi:RimJ/RimL family protein N-acetyltransferase
VAEAKEALRRLTTWGDASFNIDKIVAIIIHTNEIEKEITSSITY